MLRIISAACALATPTWALAEDNHTGQEAQQVVSSSDSRIAPHAVYLSGSSFLLRHGGKLSYEGRVAAFDAGYWRDLRVRLDGGYVYQTMPFSPAQNLLTMGAGLSVIGGRHLDLGAGLVIDAERYVNVAGRGVSTQALPQVHVAYRYQRPDSPLVFRAGIGFPDGLFASLGAAF